MRALLRWSTDHTRVALTALLMLSPSIVTAQSLTAVWDPKPTQDQVTSYEVCVGTTSLSCNVTLATVPTTETSYTFTPNGGVLYFIAVRAVGSGGTGGYSSEVRVSIPSLAQPANQTSTVNS